MIGLLDNLTLTYAESSIGPENTENLASEYIQIVDKGLSYIEHIAYSKKRLYYTKNITDLLDAVDAEELFNELKRSDETVYIYADNDSFVEFFIRWFKGLFPKIKPKTLYELFKNYAVSEKMITNKRRKFFDLEEDGRELDFEEVYPQYWERTEDHILGLFELYPAFKLPFSVKLNCNLDILLTQYVLDKNTMMLGNILMHLDLFYKNRFINEFCGLVRMINRNIVYFTNSQAVEGFNEVESLNISNITGHENDWSFLFDEKIRPTVSGYKHLFEMYDVERVSSLLLEADVMINQSHGLTSQMSYIDNPCLSYFIKNNKHPNINELVELEISNSSPFQLLKKPTQDNKLNIFLVHTLKILSHSRSHNDLKDELTIQVEG
jgi:hypothetical protein